MFVDGRKKLGEMRQGRGTLGTGDSWDPLGGALWVCSRLGLCRMGWEIFEGRCAQDSRCRKVHWGVGWIGRESRRRKRG